jgi:predicted metal-dependent phosphoesterase TrpH
MSNINQSECFGVFNLYYKHLAGRLQPPRYMGPANHFCVIIGAWAHILALLALLAHSLALRMDRITAIG